MSEVPTAIKPFTAKLRKIHLWGMGTVADYFMYSTFALIQVAFTTGYKLDPILVGWALALPRVFDAVVDPIVGHFSDNFHSRWGRRRPFILGAALLGAGLVMALWQNSPDWNKWVQFAYLAFIATMLFTMYGIFNLSHSALGYELSDDYGNRSKVLAIRSWWSTLASAGGSYTYIVVLSMPVVLDRIAAAVHYVLGGATGFDHWLGNGVSWLKPMVSDEVGAFRFISMFVAALIIIGGLIPFLTVKERFSRANRKHVNLWPAVRATLQSRTYVLIIFLRITQGLGGSLYGTMAIYIAIYYICQGNKPWYMSVIPPWGFWVGLVWATTMMFLAAPITRRLGKRTGIVGGFGMHFLWAIFLPFFVRPGELILFFVYGLIFMPFGSIRETMMNSIIPDICDIDELKHGERREGLFTAVQSFINKMEISLIALGSGYLLKYSGFDAHVTVQPPEVLHKMRVLGFTPLIFFAGVTFVISWFIPVDQEYMKKVRAELDARRAAGLTQESQPPAAPPA